VVADQNDVPFGRVSRGLGFDQGLSVSGQLTLAWPRHRGRSSMKATIIVEGVFRGRWLGRGWVWAGVLPTLLVGCGSEGPGETGGTADAGGASALSRNADGGVMLNPVVEENRRQGMRGWRDGPPTDPRELGLYVSTESARAGERIEARAFSRTPASAVAQVLRIGDYGGAGARLVWTSDPFQLAPQSPCPPSAGTALVECDWPSSVAFTIGSDWLSGVYVVRLRRTDGAVSFTPFVVRDGRGAELLLQTTFTTDQAYNFWGGESLYQDRSGTMPKGRATKVSFNRPFLDAQGLGRFAWRALDFVQFVERSGYDVTYATNIDFLREPHLVEGVGALVVAGHDEYWPAEERQQIDAAVSGGKTSLAYFGANGGYWRIRLEPDAHGRPYRTIVCFKGVEGDPQPGSTVRYRDPPDPHPENALFGIMYDSYLILHFPLVVAEPNSWMFTGTGVHTGDRFRDIVGTEFDSREDNGQTPANLAVAGVSPVITAEGRPGASFLVSRDLPGEVLVFAAGTIDWAAGLSSEPAVHDPRIERITRNVLERALAHRRPPSSLPPVSGEPPTEPPPDAAWARRVEALAGTTGLAGSQDGPGAAARFDGPTGLAVTPDGDVVVAEAWGNRIRAIGKDAAHTVRTIAGSGTLGSRDGPGTAATFRSPIGLAVDRRGVIYVADSDSHRIRRIDPGGTHQVSTVAGGPEGFADGPLASARFRRPTALAIARDGALLVVDQMDARIRRIDLSANQVTTLAGNAHWGSVDASDGTKASFSYPSAIAVTTSGDLLIVDSGNAAIRRVGAQAPHPVTTVVGTDHVFGFADGDGNVARLRAQMGAAMLSADVLVVGDTANSRLRRIELGDRPATTRVRTLAGSGRVGTSLGDGRTADLVTPAGLALLPDGSLVVSDPWNQVIRRVVP
jgi:sugar lactone lactonase YvrE